ncbi:GntR family transcriptional regulator [Actinospica sp. MGRD01-02]|uniref:GntR family transcriptional regulator n=1 Tax=Actinospica acidithermotolerans TaxID=2828514 RepID=A0A941EFT0_9ACTN|nr:GntR family transcriptional regulator [Actinospica acidithermotolerans]MBR7829608.1 GntR family transcriptional regulator [Actinospica acidithermotolerans]
MTSERREGAPLKRERIREHLLDLIDSLDVGATIPSERQLCETLGVSRPTVRSAVDGLVRDGFLVRRHGAGMFVAEPKIVQELGPDNSARLAPGTVGGAWSTRTLEFTRTSAGARIGRRLRVSPADPVLHITRLRLVDAAPVAVDALCVPARLVPGLQPGDLQQHSFYELLADRYGIEVDTAEQSIEPTVTDEEESALLLVPVHSPALLFERVTEDAEGTVVEFTRSVYRGDRYRILTRLRLADRGLCRSDTSGGALSGEWSATDRYLAQD